jgi:hypothetical protein
MKRQPWGLYAIAAAILAVGLVALGVPASTLLYGALVLACPLMMLAMMGGMHGGRGGTDTTRDDHHRPASDDHTRTAGRP